MTFTVKYRTNSGSIAEKAVEAANRADCFAKCKVQGIVPVSVKVGDAKHEESTRIKSIRSGKIGLGGKKLFWSGVMLLVAGITVWFWCDRSNRPPKAPVVKKIKKQSMPASDVKHVVKPAVLKARENPANVSAADKFPKRIEMGVEVVSSSARTNQSGAVIEKLRLADGRVIEKVTPPKPIFGNPSDQMIAVALSATPGQAVAPFPDLGSIDDDFKKSLSIPIRIEEGDSEETKELKLKVKEARAYIAAEIGQGKTAKQCLYEYREEMQRIADSHQMAINQIATMKKEGSSAAEISEFRTRINEYFREKGIAELPGLKNKNTEEKE